MFSHLGIIDFSHYFIAVVAVILLPGPNSLYVLRTGMRYGIRKGYHAALAVFIGDGVIMFAAYLGIATLINESPQLFATMRYFSAAYLFYLACQILYGTYGETIRTHLSSPSENSTVNNDNDNNYDGDNGDDEKVRHLKSDNEKSDSEESENGENVFLRALTLSLTNPKAILFFFAFFHKFIDPTFSPTAIPFAILALVLTMVSFCYLSLLIISGAGLVRFLKGHQWLGTVGNTLVALLFMAFTYQLIMPS